MWKMMLWLAAVTTVVASPAVGLDAPKPPPAEAEWELRLTVSDDNPRAGFPVIARLTMVHVGKNKSTIAPWSSVESFRLAISRDGKNYENFWKHRDVEMSGFQDYLRGDDFAESTVLFTNKIGDDQLGDRLILGKPGEYHIRATGDVVRSSDDIRFVVSKPVRIRVEKCDTTLPDAMSPLARLYFLTRDESSADPENTIAAINKHPDAPQAATFRKMIIERQSEHHAELHVIGIKYGLPHVVKEVDAGVDRVFGLTLAQAVKADPAWGAEAVGHLAKLLKATKRSPSAEQKTQLAEAGAALLKRIPDARMKSAVEADLKALADAK